MSSAEMLERMEQNESKAPEITIEEAFELYQNKPVLKAGDKIEQIQSVSAYKIPKNGEYAVVTRVFDEEIKQEEDGTPLMKYDCEILAWTGREYSFFKVESWRFKKYESAETVSE